MYIATTRFNNKTYVENMKWKIKNNFNGCCYGLPHKISEQIPPYKNIIVLEKWKERTIGTLMLLLAN